MTCTWDVDRSCYDQLPDEMTVPEDYVAAVAAQNSAEDIATFVLWALTGRQFCVEQVTARPCPRASSPAFVGHAYDQSVAPFMPVYDSGRWINLSCGCGSGSCYATGLRAVHLPGPVGEIVTVTIGATVLDEEDYTLEGQVLYRIGANWPYQDLSKPLGESGTWSVTYDKGTPPPSFAAKYVGLLAKEFMTACAGGKCRLPRTVVSTTRSGVTHSFDPSRILNAGYTGIPEIDSWVAAVNPQHLLAGPRVR